MIYIFAILLALGGIVGLQENQDIWPGLLIGAALAVAYHAGRERANSDV